jgi:beta-galactosidase GanA
VIAKVLIGAAGAALTIGLAAPAGADPVPPPNPDLVGAASPAPPSPSTPAFLAAARAAGITGADPAMLEDGNNVCWQLWDAHAEGTQVAADLSRDHPGVTIAQAANFVLAAYHNLCPVPGAEDYWAYSTS